MKQTLFTLLLITCIGLISCRKTKNDPNITQYDQTQIQNYISANGLTAMKRDVSNGDTSGIYYQILSQGSTTGAPLDYPDSVAFVLTVRSFDGKYVNADTLNLAHFDGLLGHITGGGPVLGFTKGLQYAIHDIIKYRGTRARVLVPSRVAYGVNGIGTGSSSNTGTRILGNQCLDYYINVISDVNVYDRYLINQYITKNNLSGFNEVQTGPAKGMGLFIKVVTPGTGTDPLSEASSFTSNYTGKVLNGGIFGSTATDAGTSGTTTLSSFTLGQLILGVQYALNGQTAGAAVSMLIPSRLGYGKGGSGTTIGPDVPLYYDFTVSTVSNP